MDKLTYVATVAERVAVAMEAKERSQVWLSDQTGIPRTTLIRRLSGHAPFTLAEIAAIASALGIDVDELTRSAA